MIEILAQANEQQPAGGGSLLIFLPLILLFWFFLIRPQRQRMRQHQALIREVQIGDEIETVAGVYGTVRRMGDDVLWVEVAPGTEIKMSRAAVRRRVSGEEPSQGDLGSTG